MSIVVVRDVVEIVIVTDGVGADTVLSGDTFGLSAIAAHQRHKLTHPAFAEGRDDLVERELFQPHHATAHTGSMRGSTAICGIGRPIGSLGTSTGGPPSALIRLGAPG